MANGDITITQEQADGRLKKITASATVQALLVAANQTAARAALGNAIPSDTTDITGASVVANMVFISQANYDLIVAPDASTLYIIV